MHNLLFLLIMLAPSFAQENKMIEPPFTGDPKAVSVGLYLNKILNISTIDESFQVDGYLVLSWHDERLKYDPEKARYGPLAYVDDKARELIKDEIWFPPFELVNVLEKPESHNTFLIITHGGKVYYTERFTGLFYSDMDYTKFPFDSQSFQIVLESFLYDKRYMLFDEPIVFPNIEESKSLLDKWEIQDIGARTEEYSYSQFDDHGAGPYSRVVFQVDAKRVSGYYVWQVLFPLVLIILASFVIFWVDDFGDQLSIGFTLMLTVVAFNFFSSSILPKLPYNTFIESVILVGYVFIFLSIVGAVINNSVTRNKENIRKISLLKYFRILFPACYITSMLLVFLIFYM